MRSDFVDQIKDEFTLADVGSSLLQDLAKGLYQHDEVIREYVQNAVDAHRLWKHEMNCPLEGPIQIEIRDNLLSIMDYGIGMDEAEIRRVKSIAVSNKRDADIHLTGHKGVGIWAGLSYFQRLSVFTTKRGNDSAYELIIEFKKIVDSISDSSDIGAVLNPNYRINRYKADVEDHKTTVTLEGPTSESSSFFLDKAQVAKAVRRICPCELDENLFFYDKLMAWYQQHGIELFPIFVDGDAIYRSYPGDKATNFL